MAPIPQRPSVGAIGRSFSSALAMATPLSRQMFSRSILGLVAFGMMCHGCGLPRDPEETLGRVTHGTMRVGIIDNYPQVQLREGAAPAGSEVEVVKRIAGSLNSEIVWIKGGEDELLRRLERFDVDLVIGGIREDTPWQNRVALSRPYDPHAPTDQAPHVLAMPPGENGWLTYVDRWINQHQPQIAALLEEPEM